MTQLPLPPIDFDQIDPVLAEDGETVVAYACPRDGRDDDVVVIDLDPGTVPLASLSN